MNYFSLSLPKQQSLYNQSNYTDRNENSKIIFIIVPTECMRPYVFIHYAAAFDFQEIYYVYKPRWCDLLHVQHSKWYVEFSFCEIK